MRHSAWTLWLVPLVLPLVLLCVPGSRSPVSQPPAPVEAHELLQEEDLQRPERVGVTAAAPQDLPEDASESLLKG